MPGLWSFLCFSKTDPILSTTTSFVVLQSKFKANWDNFSTKRNFFWNFYKQKHFLCGNFPTKQTAVEIFQKVDFFGIFSSNRLSLKIFKQQNVLWHFFHKLTFCGIFLKTQFFMDFFKQSTLLCKFPQKANFGGNLQCSIFFVVISKQNNLLVKLFQKGFFFGNFSTKQGFVEMF